MGVPGVAKLRRAARFLLLSTVALGLGGCTLPTFGAFRGATSQGQAEFKLWSWMTMAGLCRSRGRLGSDPLGRGRLPPS